MIAEIDQLVENAQKGLNFGIAVSVMQAGEIVHKGAYGLANREWCVPVTPDTVFRIGGVTGHFTSTAVMLLVEQGHLHLEESLTKFLPYYPTSGHRVSIRHLLTQTSGIPCYTEAENFQQNMRRDLTPEAFAKEMGRVPFAFRPGMRTLYSHSNYFLLGLVIEQVTGMSYGDFIRQAIFEPLDMTSSLLMDNDLIVPNLASGYRRGENGLRRGDYISMTQAYSAVGVASTLNDLIKWDHAIRNHTLLSAETHALMQSPVVLEDGAVSDFGMGLFTGQYYGHPVIYEVGYIPGSRASITHFPDDDVTVILLTNFEDFSTRNLTGEIIRNLLNLQMPPRKPFLLSSDSLHKCIGTYRLEGTKTVFSVEPNGHILLTLNRPLRLLPMTRDTFYCVDDPEIVVKFFGEENGVYTRYIFEAPLLANITAERDRNPLNEIVALPEAVGMPQFHLM